jgi:phosphatidylglycerol---prolipoprotein diacylglyceryl transferase
MIPYFVLPVLHLPLGLEINAFGVIMAISLLVGAALFQRAIHVYGPGDELPVLGMGTWGIVAGMAGAHLLHVLGYHPELLKDVGPIVLLQFWEGLSSMGGVLGAIVGLVLFFRRHKVPATPYLDPLALATAPGWALARVGCFLVHDHVGVGTNFFLGVRFPGGTRHDLGLYDFFVLGLLSVVLYVMARRKRPPGTLMGFLAMGYSVPRFFLDFLRATDVPQADARYFGLTPAQYIVPFLFILGLVLMLRAPHYRPPPGPPSPNQSSADQPSPAEPQLPPVSA